MMRVVKVGGRVQADPELAAALATAHGQRHSQAAGAVVVVHGGGDEVTRLQRRLGIEPTFVGGRRVTTDADLDLVRMVLSGTANKRLVAALFVAGVRAVGISGEDGGLLRARTAPNAPLGRVGGHVDADPGLVRDLLARGWLPVVSPLARDEDSREGAALNVNGDDAAAALAAALDADELVLVADVPGVLVNGAVKPTLGADEAAALVADGIAQGGMAAKLEAGFAALSRGVRRVRIAGVAALGDTHAGTNLLPPTTAVPWQR
jgi:acetylglutamate kinase